MKTAIIFGANGQDGFYLARLLEREKVNTICVSRNNAKVTGNVNDFSFVSELVRLHQPAYLFHLAANSTTQHHALFENHEAISTGTINVLEAVRVHSPGTKVFLSGSALQFKNTGHPINEDSVFDASSAYAAARIYSVYMGRYYRKAFGLQVYFGYFFNHDSPRRTEHHVNQKIVQAVLRIAGGSGEKLELGNIEVKKEFTYAGDVVEAIWCLVNQPIVFEAVIGSGICYSIREWVECCFKKVGINWEEHVIIRNNYTPEYNTLVSDPSLIRQLGWTPVIGFEEMADIMLKTKL